LRIELLACFAALAFLALTLAVQPPSDPLRGGDYAKLPLSFVPNRGQTDQRVRYYAQGQGFGFYFTPDKAVLAFSKGDRGQALQLRFLGADRKASIVAGKRGSGKVNYLKGDDPSRWYAGLPTYGALSYQGIWPGIDMRFRGAGSALKYEFRMKPGATADRIALAYRGAQSISITRAGALMIRTPLGTLRDAKPRAWQRIDGRTVPVESRFSLHRRGGAAPAYGFELGGYDHSRPLVIDPGLAYSTYLGGTSSDEAFAVAIDGGGNAYLTGDTVSPEFPTTAGAFDVSYNGGQDTFVTKLDPSGSSLVYSTVLGGTSSEAGKGIAVDGAGNAYLAGITFSSDYPTTPGAFDTSSNGGFDAFLTKLDSTGSTLSYSSYLGGSGYDEAKGIALDGADNAYLTGYTLSADLPTTSGSLRPTSNGTQDAFVTKFNASGSALAYSTFLGGTLGDQGKGIAVDGAGSAYITGATADFPTTPGAFDTSYNGGVDAFAAKLDPSGAALDYSTYLGGSAGDQGNGIAVDGLGGAYVTGYTNSGGPTSSAFPTTTGAFDTIYNSGQDAFVTKLSATGSALSYSTFLGGSGFDQGNGISVDGPGRAYVAGYPNSNSASVTSMPFPTTAGAFATANAGFYDAFLTRLDAAGSALSYSTYLGGSDSDFGYGIAVDTAGEGAYVAGDTASSDFPTGAAFDSSYGGNGDAFVTKFDVSPAGYARPKSATPTVIRLVPAYTQCAAPNSVHGSPEVLPSCAPPVPSSSYLTVGTADSNGKTTNSAGFVLLRVLGESPINPNNGDQADVEITAQLSDVRTKGGLSDYTGQLEGVLGLRITDRLNGPDENLPATVVDTPLRFPIDCVPTDSTATGSACNVVTSADTLMAGLAREAKRAVWGVSQVQVFDGGADGDVETADNTLFEVEGTFSP
jgi:hypothetical protein